MTNRRNKLAFAIARVLAGSGLAAMAPGIALAQEAESVEILEEITVSAQLRTQSLQDVPIAIQVVDKQLLEDVAAENMGDLNGFVPGLVVNDGSPTQARYQLRGISTGDFGVGTDPAVGVYVDGIYAARSGASMTAFNDVKRIEVLKGPQGTLFGRNSAAGAISIVTNEPTSSELDSLLRVRIGDFGKTYFEGMVNAPLSEKVALRVNGVYNKSDGWLKDAGTGEELNPEENWAGRVALKWEFTDHTNATLSWDHDTIDQLARPAIGLVGNTPPIPFPADEANYVDPRDADIYNDVIGNEESRELDQVNLFINHSFAWADFRSSTSWRQFDTKNLEDEDGTNLVATYFDTGNIEDNQSIYQEFRFSGNNDRIDWVAGVSYYKEEADQISEAHTFTDTLDSVGMNTGSYADAGIPFPLYTFTSAALEPFGVTMLGLPWREAMYNHGEFQAIAAFGDVIWHINDKANLTFGLRYTQDKKEFSWFNGPHETPELDALVVALDEQGAFDGFGFPVPPTVLYRLEDIVFRVDTPPEGVTMKDTWDDVSPRVVLDYKVQEHVMWFGSLSKGYKAGGYNSVQVASEFDNEEVWNFETGIKSAFPESGLVLNTSVFYYVYDNKQAISLVDIDESGLPQYLVDTSDEQAWGIDVDAQWHATDHFTLFGNVAFIDATYKEKFTQDVVPVDLSGEPTGEPYFSAAVGARYGWVLGNAGSMDLSGRYAYRGEGRCNEGSGAQGSCATLTPFEVNEATQRLDMRLAWTSQDDKFGIAAYVTNLLDDQYVTGINNITTTSLGTAFASISEPRMWGIEATVSFR